MCSEGVGYGYKIDVPLAASRARRDARTPSGEIMMKSFEVRLSAGVCALVVCAAACCGLFAPTIPEGTIPGPGPGPHDRFVRIGGVNYHYTEYGGEGDPVVLLHGFGSSTYTWEKVAPLLERRGYHVYALDMKGFGWSDKPRGAAYDPLTLMEEVNEWMAHMGLENAALVGNSLGGAVCVLLAVEHPEKVARLVLVDPGGYAFKMPTVVRLGRLPCAGTLVRLVYGRWLIRWNLREVMYDNERVTDEQVEAYYDRNRTENGIDAQVALIRSLNAGAFERFALRVPRVTQPTLLLWGREDAWIPLETVGYRFRKELARATLVVIPRCGHIPQEEQPEITAEAIANFLEGRQVDDSCIPPLPPM